MRATVVWLLNLKARAVSLLLLRMEQLRAVVVYWELKDFAKTFCTSNNDRPVTDVTIIIHFVNSVYLRITRLTCLKNASSTE